MLQRLALAAALPGDPPILVLDEPLNGLDPEGIIWFRDLLRQMAAEGRTVFVSSHLMAEMAVTADHLLIIGEGRLLTDSDMETFERDHEHEEIRVRTPDPQALRGRAADAGPALLFANATAQRYPDFDRDEQRSFDPTLMSLCSRSLLEVTMGVLGALTVTSEYGAGTITPSLAAVPATASWPRRRSPPLASASRPGSLPAPVRL